MELLDFPEREIWEQRRDWIDNEIEKSILGSYMVSDHATALFMDLQACYCTGAWLAVVVLSISIIDAHLRETEAMNKTIGTAKLLTDFYEGDDIDWLRRLRNKYVHINLDNPALNIDMQFDSRQQLEADATRAVKMILTAFFQSPGI